MSRRKQPGQHTDELRDKIRSFGTGRVSFADCRHNKARGELPRASCHGFSKVLIQENLNGLCVAL